MSDERWLTRLRALAGVGILGWELPVDHVHHWWVLIIAVGLLTDSLTSAIALLTSGRLQIVVKREDEDKDPDE